MNFLAADVVERFYTFLWPMLRISALMITAPIFSLSAFNTRMRILVALVLAYVMVYGLSPWGVPGFTRSVGQVFDLAVSLGFILKVFLFSLAVAVVPTTNWLNACLAVSRSRPTSERMKMPSP